MSIDIFSILKISSTKPFINFVSMPGYLNFCPQNLGDLVMLSPLHASYIQLVTNGFQRKYSASKA